VAPLAGEQIFTVLSTVAVQAAHPRLAPKMLSEKNSIAVERVREEIMGPLNESRKETAFPTWWP